MQSSTYFFQVSASHKQQSSPWTILVLFQIQGDTRNGLITGPLKYLTSGRTCPAGSSLNSCSHAQLLSHVQPSATPGTVALQAPLCVGILQVRIPEWVATPSSREPSSQPRSPSLQVDSLLPESPGKPSLSVEYLISDLHSELLSWGVENQQLQQHVI